MNSNHTTRRNIRRRQAEPFWFYNAKGERYVHFGWKGRSYTWDKMRGQQLAIGGLVILILGAMLFFGSGILSAPTPFGD